MLAFGFDPSLRNFGWVLVDSDAPPVGRIVDRGTFHTTPRMFFVDRYKYLQDQVRTLLQRYPDVRLVGTESPVFGSSYSEGLYGLYLYYLQALRDCRCDVVLFAPGQLKALARGHQGGRKMFKQDMIDWAKKLVAPPGVKKAKMRLNNHEADAMVAGWFGARFFKYLAGDLSDDDLNVVETHVYLREYRITKGLRAGLVLKKGLVFREGDRYFIFSKDDLESPEVS